jgi:6-phosphogluconolactonase
MGTRKDTPYGRLEIHDGEALLAATAARIEQAVATGKTRTIGLTGGSTPKAFYAWAEQQRPFSDDVLRRATWCTSDERMVPLSSEESNFGVADRGMLTPLEVPARRKLPWPVMLDPHSAARSFNMRWEDRFGGGQCFDLCLLGMGEDGHTASIFPGSPLLEAPLNENFTCVDVPEKGWRLTITREGLKRCREILITVTGARKAAMLKAVLEGKPDTYPVQVLAESKERVSWLVDSAAAAELSL